MRGSNRRVSGSRRIPSGPRTREGASATHSPIAANDRAPASTTVTAITNNDVSVCGTGADSAGHRPAPGTRPGWHT